MIFSVIFVDDEARGEYCSLCKEEIKGKKWVMMFDSGDPLTSVPFDQTYCTPCKIKIENETGRNRQKDTNPPV